jgi:hypothetical protein
MVPRATKKRSIARVAVTGPRQLDGVNLAA